MPEKPGLAALRVTLWMFFPWTLPGGRRHEKRSVEAGERCYPARETIIYADIEAVDLSVPVRPLSGF